jgi:hypothetical protein
VGQADASIWDSAKQYGVQDRILDCLTFDLMVRDHRIPISSLTRRFLNAEQQHPWRSGNIFDSIVTDRELQSSMVELFPAKTYIACLLPAPYGVRAGQSHRQIQCQT